MRAIFLFCMALFATSAMAESSWYGGAGVGMTNYQRGSNLSDPVPELDGFEAGFKAFLGYELGTRWALEGGYIDFGSSKENSAQQPDAYLDYSSSGFYLNGQYHIPLSDRWSLDLAIGWMFGQADAELGQDNSATPATQLSFDDNGATAGLAFTWRTTEKVYLRGTVDYYMVDYDGSIKEPWRLGLDVIWDF